MRTQTQTRLLDLAVAALAGGQHAVVSWPQLSDLGMTSRALQTRVAAGRLHRIHRGVYAVVERKLLRIEGRWLAAVFAVGDGAALSHRSAAAPWDLLPATGRTPEVSVARSLSSRADVHMPGEHLRYLPRPRAPLFERTRDRRYAPPLPQREG
jgi:Transcriptional regulator, AbiEi antitoxin